MPFTILNLVPTRAYDAGDVSPNTLAHVLGTIITDIQNLTYDGTQWNILNGVIDRIGNASNTAFQELANMFFTLIADSPATLVTYDFNIIGYTPTFVLDCNDFTANILANVFATLVMASKPVSLRVQAFAVGQASGLVLYGVTGPFKTIPTGVVSLHKTNTPLHLARAKLQLAVREASFTATHVGVILEEGEFHHVSRDGYLRITNIESVSGVQVTSDEEDFAIPINYLQRQDVVLTNVYPLPTPL